MDTKCHSVCAARCQPGEYFEQKEIPLSIFKSFINENWIYHHLHTDVHDCDTM